MDGGTGNRGYSPVRVRVELHGYTCRLPIHNYGGHNSKARSEGDEELVAKAHSFRHHRQVPCTYEGDLSRLIRLQFENIELRMETATNMLQQQSVALAEEAKELRSALGQAQRSSCVEDRSKKNADSAQSGVDEANSLPECNESMVP